MSVDTVAAAEILRRFNRVFTKRIGVLDERFLGLDRPLGASRLLWEIGHDRRPVAELRESLGLDSAYLSRLLRQLEREQLVMTSTDPDDRRRRVAELTAKGRAEWLELEHRSVEFARGLVSPLSAGQRQRLVDALQTAEQLLQAASVAIQPADPADPEAIRALRAYFAELDRRFDTGFDPGDTITADADDYRSPTGCFLLARSDTTAVACGAVYEMAPGVAEVKRMWVHDDWRGRGLGRRMLLALEDRAADMGCPIIRLDTNSALLEAISLYRTSGYRAIERYNDNPFARCWFEKSL